MADKDHMLKLIQDLNIHYWTTMLRVAELDRNYAAMVFRLPSNHYLDDLLKVPYDQVMAQLEVGMPIFHSAISFSGKPKDTIDIIRDLFLARR